MDSQNLNTAFISNDTNNIANEPMGEGLFSIVSKQNINNANPGLVESKTNTDINVKPIEDIRGNKCNTESFLKDNSNFRNGVSPKVIKSDKNVTVNCGINKILIPNNTNNINNINNINNTNNTNNINNIQLTAKDPFIDRKLSPSPAVKDLTAGTNIQKTMNTKQSTTSKGLNIIPLKGFNVGSDNKDIKTSPRQKVTKVINQNLSPPTIKNINSTSTAQMRSPVSNNKATPISTDKHIDLKFSQKVYANIQTTLKHKSPSPFKKPPTSEMK